MRRSTTFAGTEASGVTDISRGPQRRRLGAVFGAQLICAVLLVGVPATLPAGPAVAAPRTAQAEQTPAPSAVTTPDGRTAQLIDLGAPGGADLLGRIGAEFPAAAAAVTGFWGERWPAQVLIAVAGSPEQFATLAGGTADVAATTTADRIMFAPAAAAMDPDDLRIVLRHELFHYAARADTAADAPVWLTEGVADYVARPLTEPPPAGTGELPTNAALATAGPDRSAAYDQAWSFARYVADTYGPQRLLELYRQACRPGHPDVATAIRGALGVDLPSLLTGWSTR